MPKSVQLCVTILSNSSKVPSSNRNSMRSRADILPSLCWRSWRSLPPPASASESRRLSSVSFCSRSMRRNYRGSKTLKHRGGRAATKKKHLTTEARRHGDNQEQQRTVSQNLNTENTQNFGRRGERKETECED